MHKLMKEVVHGAGTAAAVFYFYDYACDSYDRRKKIENMRKEFDLRFRQEEQRRSALDAENKAKSKNSIPKLQS